MADGKPGLAEHFEVVLHIAEHEDFRLRHREAPRQQFNEPALVDTGRDHIAIIGCERAALARPASAACISSVTIATRSQVLAWADDLADRREMRLLEGPARLSAGSGSYGSAIDVIAGRVGDQPLIADKHPAIDACS